MLFVYLSQKITWGNKLKTENMDIVGVIRRNIAVVDTHCLLYEIYFFILNIILIEGILRIDQITPY